MANHKSALKRAKQSEIKRLRNKGYKTSTKKAIKEVRNEVAGTSTDQAGNKLIKAISTIQKSVSKGVIHKNQAARKVSRLTRLVNSITAS